MSDHAGPLHRVEVRRAIMTSHGIQQVIQNTDTDSTSPFTHRRYHPPLVGLGIITLYAGNGVTAAPTTNCKARKILNKPWCRWVIPFTKIHFLQSSTLAVMSMYYYKRLHIWSKGNPGFNLLSKGTDLQRVPLHSGWVFVAGFWGPALVASPVAAAGNS